MKALPFICGILFTLSAFAQQSPHGAVYGQKPMVGKAFDASGLAGYMGSRTRITATIKGRVIAVANQKGGWINIDAGNGSVIQAHFQNAGMNLPASLKGKYVIAEGVASKLLIASELQHFAGDTATGKKQRSVKLDPKRGIKFEMTGLMVEK